MGYVDDIRVLHCQGIVVKRVDNSVETFAGTLAVTPGSLEFLIAD